MLTLVTTLALLVPRVGDGRSPAVAAAALLGGGPSLTIAPAYALTDLGTLGGGSSHAYAINAAGQVVGSANTTAVFPATSIPVSHAFLWQNGQLTDLGTLGGPRSQALGINSAGRVVGWATIPGIGTTRAFLWQPDRGMIDPGTLMPAGSGWDLTEASSINDAGQIVGTGYVGGRLHAFLLTPTAPTPPGTETTCFLEQNGLCIDGRFWAYWHTHGGLTFNGYPLSGVFREWLEDGQEYEVQYFERVRMEYHPGAAGTPHEVQLGQFGRRIHRPDPPVAPQAGALYFVETGHNLHDGFREYWQANGGLAQFGLPITEEIEEQLENGKVYTVQYFERARLEYHPENRPPYDVLLGHFGRRILAEARR